MSHPLRDMQLRRMAGVEGFKREATRTTKQRGDRTRAAVTAIKRAGVLARIAAFEAAEKEKSA